MPIYEFECKSCNKVFELLLGRHKLDEAKVCLTCHEEVTKIEISENSFRLKGNDWFSPSKE